MSGMSQSMFDKKPIQLPKTGTATGAGAPAPFTFTVEGHLEHTPQSLKDSRTVHVFVVIQQKQANGNAIANGDKVQGPETKLTSWSVPVTTDISGNKPNLGAGEAVGIALTVEFSDDSAGFEVYSWCQQLELT